MGWTPGVPGMAYLVEPPSTEEATARMRVIFRQVHPDPGWVLEFERRSRRPTAGRTVPTGRRARSGHPRPCRHRTAAGRIGQSPLSEPRRMSRRGCAGGALRRPGHRAGSRTRSGDARLRACGMSPVSATTSRCATRQPRRRTVTRRSWSDLSDRSKTAVLVLACVQLSLAITAWLDLIRAPRQPGAGKQGRLGGRHCGQLRWPGRLLQSGPTSRSARARTPSARTAESQPWRRARQGSRPS